MTPLRTTADAPALVARRAFLVGLGGAGAAFLVAGCGGDDTATAAPGGSDTVATSSAASAPSVATKTVTDGRGDVEVPVNPLRVITTEQTLDMVVLGVIPVGARNLENDTRSYPEFAEQLVDTFDLGGQELDMEQVIALEPDLIFATMSRIDVADQFDKIAPTVFHDINTPDKKHRWDDTLIYLGELLGKEQEAAGLLAAYEARCADFQTRMGARLDTTKVSVLRVSSSNIKIYTLGSFSGGVLRDAGVVRPENQDVDAFETEKLTNGSETEGFEISSERLREADADVMFVCVNLPADLAEYTEGDTATREAANALMENPLWSQLNAVKNGQTFEVAKHWNGESVLDANKVLDDLFRNLLPDD